LKEGKLLRYRRVIVGWKQISRYVDLSIRTTQKLYYEHGLPVRKLPTGGRIALTEELDRWVKENCANGKKSVNH